VADLQAKIQAILQERDALNSVITKKETEIASLMVTFTIVHISLKGGEQYVKKNQ